MQFFTVRDLLIPRVGLGKSGNRPSGRVGSGSGIASKCTPRVGKFQVLDLVRKILSIEVLQHAES